MRNTCKSSGNWHTSYKFKNNKNIAQLNVANNKLYARDKVITVNYPNFIRSHF